MLFALRWSAIVHVASSRRTRFSRSRYEALSDRERQVMSLVCAGLMNKQIAAEIGLSEVTVKVHRHNLMKKLEAKAAARAGENG